jgi:uncharacterized protein YlxP (DUF503 family)
MIGLLEIELFNGATHSLKQKRSHLRRLIDRLHNEFNVAVAEVDFQDTWQRTKIAVAVVSNDARHNNQVLEKVVKRIRSNHMEWQILDYAMGEVY